MNKASQPQAVPIATILKDKRLSVPIFQRSYSWTVEKVDDLLSDIAEAIENGDEDYFLGSVVLTKSEVAGQPIVVDGQQRLATVTMIYAAIRDYLYEAGHKDIASKVTDRYLYTADTWTGDSNAKLELNKVDAEFFKCRVIEPPNSDKRKGAKPSKACPSNKRIEEAFLRITHTIRELGSKGDAITTFQAWDQFLETGAKVILWETADDASAYQIFETLNDRGLDLTIADLLKNYIFGKASDQKKGGGDGKLAQVLNDWTVATTLISSEKYDAVTQFIHHYWSSKHGLIRERVLFKNIREKVKTARQAVELGVDLSRNAYFYAAMLNPEHEFWTRVGTAGKELIADLRKLKMEQYRPLLLACMDTFDQNKPKEIEKLLRLLLAWSVRFRITHQLGSSKLENFYGNAGADVRKRGIKTADQLRSTFMKDIPTDSVFKLEFARFDESNGRIARYYLRCLEVHLAGDQITSISPDEDKVNLEHILPQKANLKDWSAFDRQTFDIYLYRLGNQALLRKQDNEESGNKKFADKRSIFSRCPDLRIAARAASAPNWGPNEVNETQDWMSGLACKVWPV